MGSDDGRNSRTGIRLLSGRFPKGVSGNPAGRPKKRRPHVSAFDIIFDKKLTVSQNGTERELSVQQALQLQTYQAALKGSRMAIRAVLKMIEKREAALAKLSPPPGPKVMPWRFEVDPRNADDAMLLLGITVRDPNWTEPCKYGTRMKLSTWAAQAGISRPGRRPLRDKDISEIQRVNLSPKQLKWPRSVRQG
jgi:hypothetical protein